MAVNTQETPKICGGCQQFNVTDYKGEPIGTARIDRNGGKVVVNGWCRGGKEITPGTLNDRSVCQQPSDVFRPK